MSEERLFLQDIADYLGREGVECRMVDSVGLLARVEGKRGSSRRAVVLYVDECCKDEVLSSIKTLSDTADFEGALFALFPIEDFAQTLDSALFDGYDVAAMLMPVPCADLSHGELGFCPGKFLSSRDIFRLDIRHDHDSGSVGAGDDAIVAAADMIMRIRSLQSEDCMLCITELRSEANTASSPHCSVEGTIRSFKEGLRGRVKDMIANAAAELEYKYDVDIELDIEQGIPCVDNDIQLCYEAMLLAKCEGYVVRDLDARLISHSFGYQTVRYPSLMFYCGVGADAIQSPFLSQLALSILNK